MSRKSQQLDDFNAAVRLYPQAPVNYLLRGEYWLEKQNFQQAQADLQTARELAQDALDTSDWGYIDQSYLDRAAELLAWIERREN